MGSNSKMFRNLLILTIFAFYGTSIADDNLSTRPKEEYFLKLKQDSPKLFERDKLKFLEESIKNDYYAITFLMETFPQKELKPLVNFLSFKKPSNNLIHNLNKIILFSILLRNQALNENEINSFIQNTQSRILFRYFIPKIIEDKIILNEGEYPEDFKLIIKEYPEDIPNICFYYPNSKLAKKFLNQSSKSFDTKFLNKLALIHTDSVKYFTKYEGLMQALKELPNSWLKYKIYKKFYPELKNTENLIGIIKKQFKGESNYLTTEMSLFLVNEKEHDFCNDILKFISSNSNLKELIGPLSGKGLKELNSEFLFKNLYRRNEFSLVASTLYGLYGDSFIEEVGINFDKNPISYGVKYKNGDFEEQLTDFEVINLQNYIGLMTAKHIKKIQLQPDYSRDIQDLKNER